MTDEDLLRKLDATIERADAAIERADAAIERNAQSFDLMTRAFNTFMRMQNRLELKIDRTFGRIETNIAELGAEVRLLRDAILALLERIDPETG